MIGNHDSASGVEQERSHNVKTCAVVLMSIFCLAAMASDDKPSFTGVWTHSEQGSSTTDKIVHNDPNLEIAFKSQSYMSGVGGTEAFTTDGVERTTAGANGRLSWLTVNWQGQSLVFLRVVKDSYHVTVTREIWMLSEDGRTLTKKFRTIDMDGVSEHTQALQKQ